MKFVQGTVRGSGGRGGGGRGGGRGGSRGAMRSSSSHSNSNNGDSSVRGRRQHDHRFAARFTDPRFRLSDRVQHARQQRRTPQEQMAKAVRHDPRFAARVATAATGNDDEEEQDDVEEGNVEEDNVEEDDAETSASDVAADDDNGSDAEDEDDEEDNDEEEVAAWAPEAVEYTTPHRRLAVVNCDWDHVRAVDLYAILFHALPLGGQLHDVCVYLSNFGKRMLEHERVHGPDLWSRSAEPRQGTAAADSDTNADDTTATASRADGDEDAHNGDGVDADAVASDGWVDDNAAMLHEAGDDGEFFSAGKYRKYEMDRLRYYYAIATFDSPETAAAVYAELDGMDVEASGVVLDLQYVEDDETFDAPVSRADHMPANFTPLAAFKAAALTQSRFRISWDQDDAFRHTSVQDSFTGTSADDDLAAYLAPPDSSSDEDDNEENDEDAAEGTKTARRKTKKPATHDDATTLSRAEKKRALRRRYAALLQEIGADPDDNVSSDDDNNNSGSGDAKEAAAAGRNDKHAYKQHNEHSHDDEQSDDNDDSNRSNSSDDDDDLNRFSDVSLASSGADDSDNDAKATASDAPLHDGEVSATLDLDTDRKAIALQREARLRHQAKHGDLAAQAELKYKLRRKDAKKAKKEAKLAEKAEQRTAAQSDSATARQQLHALMRATDTSVGDDKDGDDAAAAAVRQSGKERRKQHAREVKARLASERAAMRQRRVARKMGVTLTLHEQQAQHAAAKALHNIDERFQAHLLHDPRYHIDVAQRDRRVQGDVARLASDVAAARHGLRQQATKRTRDDDNVARPRAEATDDHGHQALASRRHDAMADDTQSISGAHDASDVAKAVDYFMRKKQGQKQQK